MVVGKLPWRVEESDPGDWDHDGRCEGIRDADGYRVVTTDSGVYEPDLKTARFICLAVNSHDALVSALKDLLPMTPSRQDLGCDHPHVCNCKTRESIERAEAALQSAEGR